LKLVTYCVKADELNIQTEEIAGARLGLVSGAWIIDVGLAQRWLEIEKRLVFSHEIATEMGQCLARGDAEFNALREMERQLAQEDIGTLQIEGEPVAIRLKEARLFAPVPVPNSFRDFYAFEQHVKTCRHKRGLPMVPEWYEIPVFYFSNHRSIIGHESRVKKPEYTNELDFELEVACVIKKKGKNIPHERALEYIAGFTILNDWSARDEQRKEMAVGLGSAKGKDFATSMGPYLVTPDELEDRRSGEHWDLKMRARINGKEVSSGNVKSLYWSFARMIERASRDCELFPGDVIGSGTVGTGCILELGTDVHRYLEPGDVVELEVERLGILKNLII
jgi:2-keto-4-pentenoate hydratase/2-oxohepta-3-ene-1,7-dioic acid hydratase in catechol pathway